MTPENLIITTPETGITVVKIARPKAANALNRKTLTELKDALTIIGRDSSCRALILTGDGEKFFIAGADISEMKDMSVPDGVWFAQQGHEVSKLLELMPKPTIAAVNGYALGGGAEMAISCDFIIASDNAVFGQPEVGLGVIPGFGATLRLSRFVGLPMAKELIYTGRRIKADEALSLGLVNHVYPPAELMPKALELARSMAQQSRFAIARAKRLLTEFSETVGLNSKLDAEAQEFGQLFTTKDQREGMTAFLEKRKPAFEGLSS